MQYATKQDMINRYSEQLLIELTDRADRITNAIDDDVLDKALDDASALIDSYIARRYALPLTAAPTALRRHAEAIAWYDLHRGRHPDEVRTAYEDALKFLVELSNGTALLDIAGAQPPSAPAEAVKIGPGRTFNRNSLEGF